MAHRPRSLQHEYELFVEREIENYKESVPRRIILGIGDEAVASLEAQQQLALTELLLCEEVDRIIRARLRLATFATWRKRRVKALAEFKKPERWGMRADCAIARTAAAAHEGHVLVAGALEEGRSLYLAANGCNVTTLDPTEDVIERVINAAAGVGLTGRIRGVVSDLAEWEPDIPDQRGGVRGGGANAAHAAAATEGTRDSAGRDEGRRRARGGDELGRGTARSAGGARSFLLWMADHRGGVVEQRDLPGAEGGRVAN